MINIHRIYTFLLFTLLSPSLIAAPAGVNWQWENPKPQGNGLNSIASNADGSKMIAVGALGTILTSSDSGANWVVQASGTRETLKKVLMASNTGIVYAVGDRGTIISSPSSSFTSWSVNESNVSDNLKGISWNESLTDSVFVAVGGFKGVILTNDGTSNSWTAQTVPDGAGRLMSVAWSPVLKLFAAVSLSKKVITSPDGVDWTLQDYTASSGFRDVIWDSSARQFVAVGLSGIVATSSNGTDWAEQELGATNLLFSITQLGSDLVIAGGGHVFISRDGGIDWEAIVLPFTGVYDVLGNGANLLAVTNGGILTSSADSGVNWTDILPVTRLSNRPLTDIVWNGTRFVVASNSGYTLSSTDGSNWQKNDSPAPRQITWDGSRFVGVTGTSVFFSDDGLSWTKETIVPTNGNASSVVYGISWNGTNYIVVGASGYIITSPDAAGNNWTIQASDTTENLHSINSDGPVDIAVGNGGTMLISSDSGVSWDAISLPMGGAYFSALAWSGSAYVAVGQYGSIFLSSDSGESWTQQDAPGNNNLESAYWDGTQFIISGSVGRTFTSANGRDWVEQNNVTTSRLNAIAGDGNRLVAVGLNGTIVSSSPSYTIGGSVTGLNGSLVLQNNDGNNLLVSADGSFRFSTALGDTDSYSVSVFSQPSTQLCEVTNATGTVNSNDVTDVSVSCADIPSYTVGGSVTGLSGELVLQNNAGNNLVVSANGTFNFTNSLISGSDYVVTIVAAPATQTCVLSNASGSVTEADVTDVAVACTDNAATTPPAAEKPPGGDTALEKKPSKSSGGAFDVYWLLAMLCGLVFCRRPA